MVLVMVGMMRMLVLVAFVPSVSAMLMVRVRVGRCAWSRAPFASRGLTWPPLSRAPPHRASKGVGPSVVVAVPVVDVAVQGLVALIIRMRTPMMRGSPVVRAPAAAVVAMVIQRLRRLLEFLCEGALRRPRSPVAVLVHLAASGVELVRNVLLDPPGLRPPLY